MADEVHDPRYLVFGGIKQLFVSNGAPDSLELVDQYRININMPDVPGVFGGGLVINWSLPGHNTCDIHHVERTIELKADGQINAAARITANFEIAGEKNLSLLDGLIHIRVWANEGHNFVVTMDSDLVMDPPWEADYQRDGQTVVLELVQDATGGRLLTFNPLIKFCDSLPASTVVLSTAPGKRDIIQLRYMNAEWRFVGFLKGF